MAPDVTAHPALARRARTGGDGRDAEHTDPVAVARAHVARQALTESPGGLVGLEMELHLVDLQLPARRPTWSETLELVGGLPPLAGGSRVTLEPGGQVELSGPPLVGVVAAVTALRADLSVVRRHAASRGYGLAALGTDLARPVCRTNPAERYGAMEAHFDALGCSGAGRSMMAATASLQVNLDAGPREGWQARTALLRALVPVLITVSSTSPYLAGRSSGWHSMRQGIWQGIDPGRSDPHPVGDPTMAWAYYALSAPVMSVRHTGDGSGGGGSCDHVRPVTSRVPFVAWVQGTADLGRAPTLDDLDYHLTTLFPPVRPRGYLELRAMDAMPDRWWPALAAVVATLVDSPGAAAEAAVVCAPVADSWELAARSGLAHPDVRRAVVGCLAIAAAHAPAELADGVGDLADLAAHGRTPADLLRARIERHGALAVLEEESHA